MTITRPRPADIEDFDITTILTEPTTPTPTTCTAGEYDEIVFGSGTTELRAIASAVTRITARGINPHPLTAFVQHAYQPSTLAPHIGFWVATIRLRIR